MIYNLFIYVIKGLIRLINGKGHYEYHEDFDSDKTYVIVGPHRSILDPIIFAIALLPRHISFIAKEELFKNGFASWLFHKVHVIPVKRENPGPKTVKQAVRTIKAGDEHVGIFPTGSRYSDEIKPGAVAIAKMGKVELLPVVYQGPIEIKDLFSRKPEKRVKCRVGQSISLPDKKRLSPEELAQIDEQIRQAFKTNDAILDPSYFYDVDEARRKHEEKKKRQK